MPQLTDTKIRGTRPGASGRSLLADGLGLYLKVARSGTKTFVYRFTHRFNRYELTVGSYPAMSLAEARRATAEHREVLGSGKNPLQIKQAQQQAHRTASTVSDLVTEWHERVLQKKYRRPDAALQTLKRDVESQIGRYLIQDVTARNVALLINRIVDRGSPVAANRTLRLTKKLFAYAVEQSYISITPVNMTRQGAGGKEQAKERALSFEELRTVLKAIDGFTGRVSWQTRLGLQLLILTGQRPGEVASMTWADLDLDAGLWRLPASATKSERAHMVHLSAQAITLLQEVKAITGTSIFVLHSTTTQDAEGREQFKPIARHSLSHAVRDMFLDEAFASVEPFTPHDLRRTFATRASELGVAPHVVEKILNHRMTGVMAIYNRFDYEGERRAALDMWGTKVEELRTTERINVRHLARAIA